MKPENFWDNTMNGIIISWREAILLVMIQFPLESVTEWKGDFDILNLIYFDHLTVEPLILSSGPPGTQKHSKWPTMVWEDST